MGIPILSASVQSADSGHRPTGLQLWFLNYEQNLYPVPAHEECEDECGGLKGVTPLLSGETLPLVRENEGQS